MSFDDARGRSGAEVYSRIDRSGQGTFINPTGNLGQALLRQQQQYGTPSADSAPAPTTQQETPPLPAAPDPIDPKELAAILYDKNIPIAIGSRFEIGGRVIEGPQYLKLDGSSEINAASFTVGYFVPINYASTSRAVTELWFRGQLAWSVDGGVIFEGDSPLNVGGATTGTEQRVRFTNGTLDQAADAWSILRHGSASAVAYVPMVTGTFENIRLSQFGGIIPFTSVTIEDSTYGDPGDQIPWSDVLSALALYDGRLPTTVDAIFETVDVMGGVEALILGTPTYFPQLLAGLRKIKPYWHIRTEDKLYLVEKGPYSLDLNVERSKVQARGADPITIHEADAKDINQELWLSYLDSDRDFERNSVRAAMELEPIQTTDAFKSENVSVPVVSTADEMIVAANLALYSADMEREQSEFTGLAPYLGLQPGDTMSIPTDERTYFHTATEIVRKPDLTVEVKARGFLTCASEQVPSQVVMIATITTDADFAIPNTPPIFKGGYIHWIPAQADPATILRQSESDYTSQSTLTLSFSAPNTNVDQWTACADSTYIYMYSGAQVTGGGHFLASVRRLHSDFSTVNVLYLGTPLGTTEDAMPPESELACGRIVVLGTWLYLMNDQGIHPLAHTNNGPSLLRLSTADFSTVETIATLGTAFSPPKPVGTNDIFTDETYIYVIGRIELPASQFDVYLYRVNPATFTLVDSVFLFTTSATASAWYALGTAAGGSAYIAAGNYNSGEHASVYRVDLSTMTVEETVSLADADMLTETGVSHSPVAQGNYLYIGSRQELKVVGFNISSGVLGTSRTVDLTDENGQIFTGAVGVQTMSSDGTALFMTTFDDQFCYGLKMKLFDGDDIAVPAQPPNDDFANAVALATGIAGTGSSGLSSAAGFTYATPEVGEPNPGGLGDRETVWWYWQATGTGSFTLDLAGSDTNDGNGWVAAVYTGDEVSDLTLIASDNDLAPAVPFSATSGTIYHFQVQGWADSAFDPDDRGITVKVS